MASAIEAVSTLTTRTKEAGEKAVAPVRRGVQNGLLFAEQSEFNNSNRAIMGEIQMIGGALVAIVIIALVLTEVYDAVEVGDGPFAAIVDSAETTGVAAISLLVVGLLVLAASTIMRFMGGSGFGR